MNLPIIILCGQAGVGKDTVAGIIKKKYGFQTMAQADPIKELGKRFFAFTDAELWGPSENRNKVVSIGDLEWRANQAALQDGNTDVVASISFFRPTAFPASGYGPNVLAKAIDALRGMVGGEPQPATVKVCYDFYKSLATFIEEKGGLSARIVLQLLGTEVGRAVDKLIWTKATLNKAQLALDSGAAGVVISDGRFRSEVLQAKSAGGKAVLIKGTGVETNGAVQHASEVEILTVPQHFFDLVIDNDKTLGTETLGKAFDLAFDALFPVLTFKGYSQGEEVVYYLEDPRQE